MDFSLIETLLTVVRLQNLSKAAQELNLAQTTVSKRLKVLEEEVGITLIERGKGFKKIRPTASGEQFIKLAEQWSSIQQEFRILQKQGPVISLVVGSIDSFNTFFLPQMYRAIIKQSPPVRLEVRTLHSLELYEEVENRRVDVGFVLREQFRANVHVAECFSSPMVVLRLANSDETSSEPIHPSKLDSNHELYLPWGASGYQIWHGYWWDPLSPCRIRIDSTSMLLNLLNDPRQWAILPKWIADIFLTRGKYLIYELTDPPPNYTCFKLTHKNPTSITRKALKVLDDCFQLALQDGDNRVYIKNQIGSTGLSDR